MNRFGMQAMTYWQRWLPSRYSMIEDPQAFFTSLGEQVQDQITDSCLEWEHRDREQLNALDYMQRVGRLNAIRQSVTEAVLTDLMWLEPEPGTLESEPPTTMPVDPQSEWVDDEGMPVDPEHPLHRMLEDDNVSPRQFKAALQTFWDGLRVKTSQ